MSAERADRPAPEVRNTRQRRAVAQALATRTDFVSAQELHGQLQEAGQSVSLATTYRVLQSMTETGETDVLLTPEGESRYRRCATELHHHHLVCRRCGATVEIEAPAVERWAEEVSTAHGYVQTSHTVEITGLCPRCAEETAERAPETEAAPSAEVSPAG